MSEENSVLKTCFLFDDGRAMERGIDGKPLPADADQVATAQLHNRMEMEQYKRQLDAIREPLAGMLNPTSLPTATDILTYIPYGIALAAKGVELSEQFAEDLESGALRSQPTYRCEGISVKEI